MGLTKDHDLHKRRRSRNLMLGLVLGGFVALVFGITVVKMAGGANMMSLEHSYPEVSQ